MPRRRGGPEEGPGNMTRLHEQVACTPNACIHPCFIALSFSTLINGLMESSCDWVTKEKKMYLSSRWRYVICYHQTKMEVCSIKTFFKGSWEEKSLQGVEFGPVHLAVHFVYIDYTYLWMTK